MAAPAAAEAGPPLTELLAEIGDDLALPEAEMGKSDGDGAQLPPVKFKAPLKKQNQIRIFLNDFCYVSLPEGSKRKAGDLAETLFVEVGGLGGLTPLASKKD